MEKVYANSENAIRSLALRFGATHHGVGYDAVPYLMRPDRRIEHGQSDNNRDQQLHGITTPAEA
jgi:hypothetical protein